MILDFTAPPLMLAVFRITAIMSVLLLYVMFRK
jgi:hypothetical protein